MEGLRHEQPIEHQPKNEINHREVIDTLGLSLKFPSIADQQGFQLYSVELPKVSDREKEREPDIDLLQELFPNYSLQASEPVVRDKDDTTLFTTSGIQRIESMLHSHVPIDKDPFIVYQPVLRSQNIDHVNEGSSSSFINITLAHVDADPDSFFKSCTQTLCLLSELGFSSDEVLIKIEEGDAAWGKRVFKNTTLTLICRGVEVGECIYSQSFPFSDTERGNIIDVGIGLERMMWSQKKTEVPFLSAHRATYESLEGKGLSRDKIVSIIDPVRSMVLIALEGVVPSNKNQGYRFRQLSKRFVVRSFGIEVGVEEVIRSSYEEWTKYGHASPQILEEVSGVILTENDRNYNRKILDYLKEKRGVNFDLNINQSTEQFLGQLSHSINKQELSHFIKSIQYEEK